MPHEQPMMFGESYFRCAARESNINFHACDAETFPDPIAATVGFNLAVGFFHRGKSQSALSSIRAILRSPNMPHALLCDASLLEINVLLHNRQAKELLVAIKNLQGTPWWAAATAKQKETAERLVTRARAMASVDKFTLTTHQQEKTSLGWLVCQAEVEARNGDVENAMSRLLRVRLHSSIDEQGLIDNTLGCIYSTVLKNPSFGEAFFRSAMKATRKSLDSSSFGVYGSVPRSILLHNTALSLAGQRRYKDAFKLFMLTMPYYHHCPRYWLRLAECCILHLQNCSTVDESNYDSGSEEQDVFRKAMEGVRGLEEGTSSHSSFENITRGVFHDLKMGEIPDITYTNALTCLMNAQTFSGDNRNYLYLLSSIHSLSAFVNLQLGRFYMALRAATALLNLPQSTSNPELYVRGVLLKAEALVAVGQNQQALTMLDHIATATQRFSSQMVGLNAVAYNRSVLYARVGKVSKAIEIYEQLKRRNCTEGSISNLLVLERYLLSLVKRNDGSNPLLHMYEINDF